MHNGSHPIQEIDLLSSPSSLLSEPRASLHQCSHHCIPWKEEIGWLMRTSVCLPHETSKRGNLKVNLTKEERNESMNQ